MGIIKDHIGTPARRNEKEYGVMVWIRPDGVADAYDQELDTVIHLRDKEEQEAFEQWLQEEAGKRFREWREKRA